MADALAFPADLDGAPPAGVARSRRVIARPRSLPGRRALAGGFLVAAAAVGLFSAFAHAGAAGTADIMVASHELAVGSKIGAADLRPVRVRVPTATKAHAFSTASDVQGRVVVSRVGEGEVVQRGSVIRADDTPPYRSLTVLVDGAQLQAVDEGDVVDVLVTTGTGASTTTDVVTGGARVLRAAKRSSSLGSDGKVAVTFALGTFEDVTRLVQAAHAGSLTLVRANGFAAQPPTYDAAASQRSQGPGSRP